jgi:hypothetical protein
VTPKPTPAAASGIASIPAPMVVPATIKTLPRVRFFTYFLYQPKDFENYR